MNSLRTTRTFESLDKIQNISAKHKDINSWIHNYTIKRSEYDYLIQICKTFTHALTGNVVPALERGEVVPVLFDCPNNDKSKAFLYPTSISAILANDKRDSKKIISYVDTSPGFARYSDKIEKTAFAMDTKSFFMYAQRGYVARILQTNAVSLRTTPLFVKAVVNSYARMVAKPISAVYATGAKEEWMQKLLYLTIVFALQNFFNYDQEKARSYALSFPGIIRSYIIENSKFYNCKNYPSVDMSYDVIQKVYHSNKDIKYPIDVYIQNLRNEFEEMRNGKIQFRTIMDRYLSMYQQNALFSFEHCASFVNMILTTEFGTTIYNDTSINNICKPDIDTIIKIFQMIKS